MARIIGIILILLFLTGAANANETQTNADANAVKIRLLFDDNAVTVTMHDNAAARDFINMLPLTLTFEDYAGTEKINRLAQKLATWDAPAGFDPTAGDFTYYAPWGNIAIFYKDFGYSSGLVSLGRIDAGMEKLAAMDGNFTVTIEKAE